MEIIKNDYKFMTAAELAMVIKKAPIGTEFNFTLDTQEDIDRYGKPSEWYGAKIIRLFDECYGFFTIGYWGGDGTEIHNIEHEVIKSELEIYIEEWICNYMNCESDQELCVEIDDINKPYLKEDMKYYDVFFNTIIKPVFTVKAKDKDDAFQKGQDTLNNMSKEEILEMFKDALDYCDVEVIDVDCIGDADEEE